MRGLLYYNGQSRGNSPLSSLNDLFGEFTDGDLAVVRELSASACAFTRIDGLQRVPNLRVLQLVGNELESMSSLGTAPSIQVLNLSQNRIKRIEGLETLPNLRELYLAHNQITRIEGLEGLSKLEVLVLVGNEIEEISGVSHLKALRRLELAGNRLRNIVALQDLPSLELVSIESSRNQLDERSLRFIEEWNAKHAGKPGLQLRSGMPAAGEGEVAPAEPGVETPAPP